VGQARETMDRLTEAVFKKDYDTLATLYAPTAVAVTPEAGELIGRDAVLANLRQFIDAFPDAEYEPAYAHESGDTAIDEGYFTGTHTQPLPLPDGAVFAPTARRVRLRVCDVATVEGGVVVSHRFYYDQADLLEQLGVTP
jgi:ketosteroid isomerase-like protein